VLGRPPALCLVANDLDYLTRNGGIGTYNWLMAHLLAGEGWRVHVLYCGAVRSARDLAAVTDQLAGSGIGWSCLHDFDEPPVLRVPGTHDAAPVHLSDRVRYALEELHGEHHFDLAEFGEWGALGFRSIQARRAGLAFADLPLAVKLHSPSQWMREGNHLWLTDPAELEVDYCERYAFENADLQLSPSRYMLDYAAGIGWKVRPDARVISYPFPAPQFVPAGPAAGTPEVVFFGRLETRKGLEVFLEAARQLGPHVPLTFLGRVTRVDEGRTATDLIHAQLPRRPFTLLTDYNREQALRYLSQGNRLAVMASLADNSPFTVIECATNGIPFVASRVGGIPELLADPETRKRLLFEPNPRDLLRCLRDYLAADPAENAALRDRVRAATDVVGNNRRVAQAYAALPALRPDRPTPAGAATGPAPLPSGGSPPEPDPLVTVAIAHYNLGAFLPDTLESLAGQTYRNLEVLVIDDGSTDPDSLAVLAEQQRLHPPFRFLSHANAGIGATRNRGLHEARGQFFIPMDADNIACPDMVQRLVTAMRRNPDVAATTCFYLAFRDAEALARRDYQYAYRPTGGPQVLASVRNVYGDANAIFRTEVFRSVGGYETDRDTSWEDWEAFVKLVNAGHRVDVLPDYLFYYRHLDSGFSRTTKLYLNHQRVLRQFFRANDLPTAERIALWTALASLSKRNDALHLRLTSLRYRVADRIHDFFARSPALKKGVKWLLTTGGQAWHQLTARAG
jgi:glycosyltransferase involved in cell wall biosynthesis